MPTHLHCGDFSCSHCWSIHVHRCLRGVFQSTKWFQMKRLIPWAKLKLKKCFFWCTSCRMVSSRLIGEIIEVKPFTSPKKWLDIPLVVSWNFWSVNILKSWPRTSFLSHFEFDFAVGIVVTVVARRFGPGLWVGLLLISWRTSEYKQWIILFSIVLASFQDLGV
jgi:hypothetical protein